MSRKTAKVWFPVAGILLLVMLTGGFYWSRWKRSPAVPTIAFIPQTAGAMLWDVEHLGATAAAEKLKCRLYWNAPTSENDLAGQVSLIEKVSRSKYQGLVLAPNHPLAMLAPLRRALAAGLPVVVVSAALDLPASNRLGYIVNDDQKMGELAAREIATLIGGEGAVALVGSGRYAPGVTARVRAAENLLASQYPGIRVVSRAGGANNASFAEERTYEALDSHPGLKAILSFTATSTRGVHAALKNRSLLKAISLVGCEQDSDLMGFVASGEIAAVLAENTYRMGYEAVGLITDALAGKPMPQRSPVPPLLITRSNVTSADAVVFTGPEKAARL